MAEDGAGGAEAGAVVTVGEVLLEDVERRVDHPAQAVRRVRPQFLAALSQRVGESLVMAPAVKRPRIDLDVACDRAGRLA